MIRRLISLTLFVGLGTGMVVAVLLAVLPSVRIAGSAAATDGSLAAPALLVDEMAGGAAPASPEAWRRCPYLAAVAARSRCPYLAAVAGGSACLSPRANPAHPTCPFLRSWPGRGIRPIPGADDPARKPPPGGAVLARLDPPPPDERTGGRN